MTSATRYRLCALQQSGDLDALQAYCQELLFTEDDAVVRGCLLWNLSDVYAMRRSADALYKNHRRFKAHVQTMSPKYRLWLVSDGTQRLTLEHGGYDGFWWDMYMDASANYSTAHEVVLFEAHRAAFYKSPQMPYDHNRALSVKERFVSFLEAVGESPAAAYYRLVYATLCLKQFGEAEQDIVACCEPFLADLRHPAEVPLYASGEWDALNGHRSRRTQAQVGVNNAVNALIDSGNAKQARDLYKAAREHGLCADHYIEGRL